MTAICPDSLSIFFILICILITDQGDEVNKYQGSIGAGRLSRTALCVYGRAKTG